MFNDEFCIGALGYRIEELLFEAREHIVYDVGTMLHSKRVN